MPNQRKAGMKRVNAWLTENEKEELMREAREAGCSTVNEFLRRVAAAAKKEGKKV